jgi:hypothetical protein
VRFVSFCSNHNLGTALPPPSAGGLRPNSPATCGSSTSHPALSRRPRAVGAGTRDSLGRSRAPRQGVRPQPVAFRGCSVRAGAHLLCSPLRHAPAGIGRDRIPRSRPRSRRLTLALPLQAFGLRRREPPVVLCLLLSELASHEVPGLGAPALLSALGLEDLASALAIGPRRLRIRPAVASLPPPPRQPCWRTKCRDVAISTRTKASEGLESCRRGGASYWGAFGECTSGRLVRLRVMLSGSAPADRLHSST